MSDVFTPKTDAKVRPSNVLFKLHKNMQVDEAKCRFAKVIFSVIVLPILRLRLSLTLLKLFYSVFLIVFFLKEHHLQYFSLKHVVAFAVLCPCGSFLYDRKITILWTQPNLNLEILRRLNCNGFLLLAIFEIIKLVNIPLYFLI